MKRMWTKKEMGEVAVEAVNAGISSGVVLIPDEVYEYTLSAAETANLLAGLTGEVAFEVALGIDYTEAQKHPAIRLVAEGEVEETPFKLEALLVEIGQAYANGVLAKFSYQGAKPMGLNDSNPFALDLVVVDGNPILDGTPHQEGGGGATLYQHDITISPGFRFTIINDSSTQLNTKAALGAWLYANGYTTNTDAMQPSSASQIYVNSNGSFEEDKNLRIYSTAGTSTSGGYTKVTYSPSIDGGSISYTSSTEAKDLTGVNIYDRVRQI